MQNRHQDALFDNYKYYFPPDIIAPPKTPKTPLGEQDNARWHDGHKYADVTPVGSRNSVSSSTEPVPQGAQTALLVGSPNHVQQPRIQPQLPQPPQYEGPGPNANQIYGQSSQTLSLSQISSCYDSNPPHGSQPIASNTKDQPPDPDEPAQTKSLWVNKDIKVKRWVVWAISGTLILIIGIGAILGGIIGSQIESAKNAPGNNPGNNSTTTNGTSPNTPQTASTPSVRLGSRLAVTGYRNETDYNIRLFYQDKDNQIQFVDKEGASANWSAPTVLDLPYQPIENGTIAAGSYISNDPVPKLELFYEDKDGIIRGQNFNFRFENGTIPVDGEPGSINTYPLQIAGNTRISCYFPYLISQDADNSIRWSTMVGQNATDRSAPWWINSTDWNGNVKATKGSGIVTLPIAQNSSDLGGIVYRSNEGTLSIKIHDESAKSNQGVSWRKGALSKEIPADSPIGAFAVGRPYDNNNQINTYILYQDNNGIIQVVWQDGDSWQGPETYDALGSANNGTDIACLTPGADDAANVEISKDQNMNRCFYQTQLGIKEVWFDGSDWHDEGILPI
ncbi:hypothetical protein F5B19DRAFT_449621 [Rostrohypoxylon terebratum]|nr:hypothetical protein F5B19DRAFT_449621 [Rostrohypoxylon terebratum]